MQENQHGGKTGRDQGQHPEGDNHLVNIKHVVVLYPVHCLLDWKADYRRIIQMKRYEIVNNSFDK